MRSSHKLSIQTLPWKAEGWDAKKGVNMKRLSDMSDEEILNELKKKPEKWTFKTHDEYMERLNQLHKQAGMHNYGKSSRN